MAYLIKELDYFALSDVVLSNMTTGENSHGIFCEIKWIQSVTSILSIIGSGSIIGYAVFQNVVRSPEVRPLFYLSVSNLLLALCWLIGAVMYSKSNTNRDKACYNVQTLGQMFYASTFLYTLNNMWQLYNNIKIKLEGDLYNISRTKCYIRRLATVLSSAVPFLLTIPVLGLGNSMECYANSTLAHSCLVLNIGSPITSSLETSTITECRRLHYYSTAIFLLIFTVTAIPMLVILGITYTLLKSNQCQDQQQIQITVTKRKILLHTIVFFFCSMPALILALQNLVYNKSNARDILYMIQALTALSQGLFNCLVYGWTQQMLRSLKQSTCRDADTQTPLLSSQKRFYATTQHLTQARVPYNISSM
ncbi:transmembrane protein 116 [Discoglossus pictus]